MSLFTIMKKDDNLYAYSHDAKNILLCDGYFFKFDYCSIRMNRQLERAFEKFIDELNKIRNKRFFPQEVMEYMIKCNRFELSIDFFKDIGYNVIEDFNCDLNAIEMNKFNLREITYDGERYLMHNHQGNIVIKNVFKDNYISLIVAAYMDFKNGDNSYGIKEEKIIEEEKKPEMTRKIRL